VIFGTLSADAESLEDYLGPEVCEQIARIYHKPVRLLGYQRQRMNGNWKLYVENSRDNYHASLLHAFLTAFGMGRATQKGGQAMDERHRHTWTFDYADSDNEESARAAYASATPDAFKLKLRDPSFLKMRPERNDGLRGIIMNVFPCTVFVHSGNAIAIRQVRPKSAGVPRAGVHPGRLRRRRRRHDRAPADGGEHVRARGLRRHGGRRGGRDRRGGHPLAARRRVGGRGRRQGAAAAPVRPRHRPGGARLLVDLRAVHGHRATRRSPLMAGLGERIGRLFADYAWLLDAERYEEWLELFAETATYQIVPRENVQLGLPASLMLVQGQGHAARPHHHAARGQRVRHLQRPAHLGLPRFDAPVDDILSAETPFAVYHTDQEGVSRLFGVGEYRSRISCAGSRLLFEANVVVLDTFSVPTLLADPL
jgi:3-phenylpropionate/cinnamic acid dioxygenase small subunit